MNRMAGIFGPDRSSTPEGVDQKDEDLRAAPGDGDIQSGCPNNTATEFFHGHV